MRYDESWTGPDAGVSLNQKELICLEMTSLGHLSAEIGKQIGMSEHAVEDCLASAARKLKAPNRFMAVIRAMALGLIGQGPDDSANMKNQG